MDLPGERLVIKLWETITEKGLGGLVAPWQVRRVGHAQIDIRRDELLALAQAERDAIEIRAGRKRLLPSGELIDPSQVASEIDLPLALPSQSRYDSVARASISHSIQSEVNVARAILNAEQELENDAQPPPEATVDEDWLFRWRTYAGGVSADELQKLWGRVLAGEIKSPGKYSLRTLEFVKNLSRQEALDIARLSSFVVAGNVVRVAEELLDREGITFGYLLRIQQLGIIDGVGGIGLRVTFESDEETKFARALVCHNRVLLVSHPEPATLLQLEVYQITPLGTEVLSLGTFKANNEYLLSVGEKLVNLGFTVKIADYQHITDREGRFFNAREVGRQSG
jgi:hypothetical protein